MKLAVVLIAMTLVHPPHVLSDRDLLALDAKPFDKRAMMGKTVVLGRHHGVRVIAEHPCSDVCPNYTVRIIHYDAEPGPACDRIGGATVFRNVPVAIAVVPRKFCVPKVLARAK